jgi:very-short-patch-repair endonuclease
MHGLKFRRQHPVGPYTADFHCPNAKLVVEIDGWCHNDRLGQDKVRDQYMASLGLLTIRFTAQDVLSNLDGVLTTIAEVALERVETK